ncbi:topoisomerase I binding, arginine/serine-rich a [Entelurus aequoreus]|uniref:topoisomerase I binding, arginine/serine-rich a n=1 Tax=Entelurus aequoreus TaxID=161455 RepID=UPI002B1E020F|nr:topoisomerase I binding, arginine/serine-rich a [Entelurus aequoreus]
MSAIKLALQQNQKRNRRKTPETQSAEVSPDSKCPICLDIFNNISYLDICLHKFCFRCIHEWSKNKAECPLCKQPFNSIYHSIKSEQDFKQYDLKPVTNGSFGMFGGVRFRYRTTLTGVQRQQWGRTSTPPDNGVLFESPANPPQQRETRFMRRVMMTMAARRKAASEGRTLHNVREQEMINFRRDLYRQGLRVRNVRDGGRCRDTSAEFYRRNPACLHRLIPWLKRELVVLYGAHGSLVNIVQHIIMSRITRVDVEDGAIQEELRPFLQGRTEHFLHEFISFAKSPFNMEAYDQHAVYDGSTQSSNSDSSSTSSVIAISEDEGSSVHLEPPRTPGYNTSNLSLSLWDDETPGPSYSTTAEQSRAETESVQNSDSDSSVEEGAQELADSPADQTKSTQIQVEDSLSSDSDDCLIVGYVKPNVDRTPELVHLSSDSESISDNIKEEPPEPQKRSGTLNSGRHNTSSQLESKDRGRRDRSSQKRSSHKRKKSSREHRCHSRSSVTCHSREYSYSSSRESHHTNDDSKYHRKESYFRSSRKLSYRHARSRSRSRDSRRRDREKSRSRTYSSSRSPSTFSKRSHRDKPGGKRKYKLRHLEDHPKDDDTCESKDKTREEENSSPKVELDNETSASHRSRRHKKKKKHKKKSRRHKSSERAEKRSSSFITINSDSDHVNTSSRDLTPVNNVTGQTIDSNYPVLT